MATLADPSFQPIWDYFDLCHAFFGLGRRVFFLEKVKTPTGAMWERIVAALKVFYVWTIIASYVILASEATYFTVHSGTSRLRRVLTVMEEIAGISGAFGASLFIFQANCYRDSLKWCEKKAQRSYKYFKDCTRRSQKIFKVILVSHVSFFGLVYVVHPILTTLLSGRFTLALPLYLPFYPPDSIRGYLLNFGIQLYCGMLSPFGWGGLIGTFGVCAEFQKASIRVIRDHLTSIKTETSSEKLQETLKKVARKHMKLIKFQLRLRNLGSILLMAFEIYASSLTVIFWITIVVTNTEHVIGVSVLGLSGLFLLLCHITETIVEEYETLSATLYDLEWYNMKPRDRRVLSFILIAMNRRHLMTVGPFFEANYEHFYDLVGHTVAYCLFFDSLLRQAVGEA